jgi:hypothetical protein
MVMKVRARDGEAAPIAVLEASIHVARQRGGRVGLLAARALDRPVAALGREVCRAVAQSERHGAAERAVRAAHHERLDPARELEVDLWVLVGRERPAVYWTALGQATVALRLQPEGDALPAKGVPRRAARQPARREHQAEAIAAVAAAFAGADRGQLIMACGTGKTFTMEAIERAAVGTIFAQHGALRVSVNYFEIVGKRCVDLLAPGQREIVLKEEPVADGKVAQAVALVGATEVDADSAESLEACMRAGKARRATSATPPSGCKGSLTPKRERRG